MKQMCVLVMLIGVEAAQAQSTEAVATQPASGPAAEAFVAMSFDEAVVRAKAESKVLFVDFFTTWCPPCKLLDATTWKDTAVADWLRTRTVALKIDAEKNRELAQRFEVSGYPTLILIRPDGTVIDRFSGYLDARAFLDRFSASLGGRDSVARIREMMTGEGSDKPQTRLQLAEALAQQGKHAEALDEYLWCFDHGAVKDRTFVMARTATVLPRIAKLGASYPPALEALRKRRDAAEQAALSPGGSPAGVGDIGAIDRALGQPDKTFETYEKLRSMGEAGVPKARSLLNFVMERLLDAKRYEEVVGDEQVAMRQFSSTLKNIEAAVQRMPANDPKTKQSLTMLRAQVALQGGQLYEALLGLKKTDSAATLAEQMLKLFPGSEAYVAFIRGAARAGDAATARAWLEKGRAALPADKHAILEKAAESIPKD